MIFQTFTFFFLYLAVFINAQEGYVGYRLTSDGDPDSVIYETANTNSNETMYTEPDVYLNASVHVGEISILVANLSAKINVDAQVLNLLKFNAGVDAHVDRVSLIIQNVTAFVTLEARLANLVKMIDSVLDSIDLNPILVTLGQGIENITDAVGGVLDGGSSNEDTANLEGRGIPLSFAMVHNILYSVNDYSGQTHTNRILDSDGSIIEQFLDNDGTVSGQRTIGSYLNDMTPNGFNHTVEISGEEYKVFEYVYQPIVGVEKLCAIYMNDEGNVVDTRILVESAAGGSSTIGGEFELA
ncbi:hypothetical protein M501DRAFT_987543 [Patellaria atrata CBS 101060]|uniref:Uncharacterized protein n=1 Tax=Patellaria atrata CBS 101060 TaxID=1346257 RepID=A0A9P4VP47_9PEZI|nr:hypothetical protein M501DRAFT_987543 [Patellaria atrata CBS 101060]